MTRRLNDVVKGSTIILLLLLVVAATSVVDAQVVHRVPQDYPTIQAAINAARAGDIIDVDALFGPYSSPTPIVINKPLTIRSVNGRAIIDGQGKADPVVEIRNVECPTRTWLLAGGIPGEGFIVRNGRRGIVFTSSKGCGVYNLTVKDHSGGGIELVNSNNNVITKSSVYDNGGNGIVLRESNENELSGNLISHNDHTGIKLKKSHKNLIKTNRVSDHGTGISLSESHGNSITGGNFIYDNWTGTYLDKSNENTLAYNYVYDNGTGIDLSNSNKNALKNNRVRNNYSGKGIVIGLTVTWPAPACTVDSSAGNTLTENVIEGNEVGIILDAVGGNTVQKNIIRENDTGIEIRQAAANKADTIKENNIFQNSRFFGINNIGSCDPAAPTRTIVIPVDATRNWWGHPTGPSHPTNAGGLGDKVSDHVDFIPWLTAPVSI